MSASKGTVSVGQRFGRLVVVDPEARLTYPGSPYAYRAAGCQCDCGGTRVAKIASLLHGKARSCGCLQVEIRRSFGRSPAAAKGNAVSASRKRDPGAPKHHPLNCTWRHMIERTTSPKNQDYKNYGGRGITVCDEWRNPRAFYTWIEENLGPRPVGMTLDRIDVNGNYEPGNVRWATRAEQARNKRRVTSKPTVFTLTAEVKRLSEQVAALEAQIRHMTSDATQDRQRREERNMIKITITETAKDADEMAEHLRYIAGLLEEGFTSGYEPTWEISNEAG